MPQSPKNRVVLELTESHTDIVVKALRCYKASPECDGRQRSQIGLIVRRININFRRQILDREAG